MNDVVPRVTVMLRILFFNDPETAAEMEVDDSQGCVAYATLSEFPVLSIPRVGEELVTLGWSGDMSEALPDLPFTPEEVAGPGAARPPPGRGSPR